MRFQGWSLLGREHSQIPGNGDKEGEREARAEEEKNKRIAEKKQAMPSLNARD